MNDHRFAMITLSYGPDFERCELLSRTFHQFVDERVRHYIVVDQRDLSMFAPLRSTRTEVLTVESILPPWVFRLPWARRWWFSAATPPVRNWILQQYVKLAFPLHVDEELLLYVDSDVAFIRPLDVDVFFDGDRMRMLRMPGEGKLESQFPWHQTAARLLGLPPTDYFGARYIGNIVSWKKDNLVRLHDHIGKTTGRDWRRVVLSQWRLSEYILYGVFVDQVLGESAGHFTESENLCHEYWTDRPMSDGDLRGFFNAIHPEHVAVMISAKAGMDVSEYQDMILSGVAVPA